MHKPDLERFRKLLDEQAVLFSHEKLDDTMVQAYWNALKDQPFEIVEACARSHQRYGKFFPKPFELRPKGEKPKQDLPSGEAARNHIRDYWRSTVASAASEAFGFRYNLGAFQELVQAHPETLGKPLRELIDELEQQERTSREKEPRSIGMQRYAQRICEDLARRNPDLRSAHAPRLPPPQRETEERLAGF